jgi:transglutaminase-like putative cysteine protease
MSWTDAASRVCWSIQHRMVYEYSTPVAFAPHTLRLTPRADGGKLRSRELRISPPPLSMIELADEFENRCTQVTFDAVASATLIVESAVEVESVARRLPEEPLPALPWGVPPLDELAAYRSPDPSPEVVALGERIAIESGYSPIVFFDRLGHALFSVLDRRIRVEGHAQTPAETLRVGGGACRDLTMLFLAVCRNFGVAARFVSGYQSQEQSPDGKRHLHAWPEVFMPGFGWLGWDPTHGVRVTDGHFALAAAPHQAPTMPLDGGFYFNGPTVTSTLSYEIEMHPAPRE